MPSRTGRKRPSVTKEESKATSPDADVSKKAKTTTKKANFRLVFKRKALALVEDLRKEFGDMEADLNPSAPRRGSFEFVMVRDGEDDVTLWTGLKKGPPRKLKFPDSEELVKEITKML